MTPSIFLIEMQTKYSHKQLIIGLFLIKEIRLQTYPQLSDIGASRGHPIEREQYVENLRQAPWKDDVLQDWRSKSRSSVKKMRKRRAHRSQKLDDRGMEFDRHDRDRDQYDRQSRRERRSSGNHERTFHVSSLLFKLCSDLFLIIFR